MLKYIQVKTAVLNAVVLLKTFKFSYKYKAALLEIQEFY